MIPRDLQMNFPGAAYLLIGGIILFFLCWRLIRYRRKIIRSYSASPSLQKLLIPRSQFYSWMKVLCVVVCWIAVTVALMQPKGRGRWESEQDDEVLSQKILEQQDEDEEFLVRRKAHDVLFLLDTSASMEVTDTRIGKSRLEYGKEIIEEVIAHLNGQAAALYAFTSETTTIVPVTYDYLYFRLVLRQVGINEGDVAGTDLMEALETIRRKHFSAKSDKLKTLILLTDGGDTRLETLSGESRQQELETIVSRVSEAEDNQLRVFCVGLGSEEGEVIPSVTFDGKPVRSSLDETLLEQISNRGRGRYYFANDYSSLVLAQNLLNTMEQDDPFREERGFRRRGKVERLIEGKGQQIFDLYFQIPLAIALIALGAVLLLPSVRKKTLLVILLLIPSVAFSADLQESMREAETYFEAEFYDQAISKYRQLLTKSLPLQQRATIALNLGTTFLANGQYPEAIRQFRSVELGEDPSPLLRRRRSLYLSVAFVEEARAISEILDEEDQNFQKEIDHAIKNLNEAFEAIAITREADHELAIIEGREISYESIVEVRDLAKRTLVTLTERRQRYELSQMTTEQGLLFLMKQGSNRIAKLEFFSQFPEEQTKSYLQWFAEEEQTHQHLWDLLASKMEEKKEQFQQAMNHHLRGVDLLRENRLWPSRQAFFANVLGLKILLAEEAEKDLLEIILADRILVRRRQQQTKGLLLQALEQDDKTLSELVYKIAEAVHDQFTSENKQLMVGLSTLLLKQLEQQGLESAIRNYVSYQQMKMTETETLLLIDQRDEFSRWRTPVLIDRFKLKKQLEAQERFDEMIALLERGDIEQALIVWAPKEFVMAKLKAILQAYTTEPYSTISKKHRRIDKIVKKVVDAGNNEIFPVVADELEKAQISLDAAENTNNQITAVFLADAQDHDRKAYDLFSEEKEKTPETILQEALAEQEHALKITELIQQIPSAEQPSSLRKIAYRVENETLKVADDFLPMLKEQLSSLQQQCQISPWDEVIPLFHQGYDEATLAETMLGRGGMDWSEVALHEENAAQAWKDALDKLKQPPEQPEQDEQQQEQQQQQQQQQEQQQQEQSQVLQTLLEMNQEDQITPKGATTPKKGLRPW